MNKQIVCLSYQVDIYGNGFGDSQSHDFQVDLEFNDWQELYDWFHNNPKRKFKDWRMTDVYIDYDKSQIFLPSAFEDDLDDKTKSSIRYYNIYHLNMEDVIRNNIETLKKHIDTYQKYVDELNELVRQYQIDPYNKSIEKDVKFNLYRIKTMS